MSMVMGFDGNTGVVDCGGGGTLNLNAAFTIEVLFKKRTSSVSIMELVGRWVGAQGYILFIQTGGRVSMYINGVAAYADHIVPVKDEWVRASFTWIAGGNLRAYKNGVLADTLAIFAACTDSGNNLLISGTYGSFPRFDGSIAQVTAYNRVLSVTELAYNYAHPNNPIKLGCVLNLTQESLFGGQWKDLSGSANHGTLSATGVGPIQSNLIAGRNVSL